MGAVVFALLGTFVIVAWLELRGDACWLCGALREDGKSKCGCFEDAR